MLMVEASEAPPDPSLLLQRDERGEEVVVTRRGKAVARLVPMAAVDWEEVGAAVERLKELRGGTRLRGESWKALREAARR